MHRRLIAACILAAMPLVPAPDRADAPLPSPSGNQGHHGWTNGPGVGASASTPQIPGSDSLTGGGGGSPPVWPYTPLSGEESAMADEMATSGLGPAKVAGGSGIWYRQVCVVDSQGNTNGTVMWLTRPVPAADPLALAQQALDYEPLGAPQIHLNPATDRDQLVGVTTWLWLNERRGPR